MTRFFLVLAMVIFSTLCANAQFSVGGGLTYGLLPATTAWDIRCAYKTTPTQSLTLGVSSFSTPIRTEYVTFDLLATNSLTDLTLGSVKVNAYSIFGTNLTYVPNNELLQYDLMWYDWSYGVNLGLGMKFQMEKFTVFVEEKTVVFGSKNLTLTIGTMINL